MIDYKFGTMFRLQNPTLLGSTNFYILSCPDFQKMDLVNLTWGNKLSETREIAHPDGITREELERYADYFLTLGYKIEALKDCKLTFTVIPVVVVEEETACVGWWPGARVEEVDGTEL
jgi:hypothetical protein